MNINFLKQLSKYHSGVRWLSASQVGLAITEAFGPGVEILTFNIGLEDGDIISDMLKNAEYRMYVLERKGLYGLDVDPEIEFYIDKTLAVSLSEEEHDKKHHYGVFVSNTEREYIFINLIDQVTYLIKYKNAESSALKLLVEYAERYKARMSPSKEHNTLYMFTKTRGEGYSSVEIKSKKAVKIENKEVFYPAVNHDKLTKFFVEKNLSDGKILLLYGPPGTGKTTYIRDLVANHGTNEVLLFTAEMSHSFSDPAFVLSLITEHPNSLIIIEDAENLIESRENVRNSIISDFLNLTDGIMGDAANVRILLTFNTDLKNIDPAVRRKGRLYFEQSFPKLSAQEANAAFKLLGKPEIATESMSLAEIYNSDNKVTTEVTKETASYIL